MTCFGWQPAFSAFSVLRVFVAPGGEMRVHAGDEGGELRVLVDRGLDRRLFHGEIEIAGAVGLNKRASQLRADGPVALQRIDIAVGNAAAAGGLRCPAGPRACWLSM